MPIAPCVHSLQGEGDLVVCFEALGIRCHELGDGPVRELGGIGVQALSERYPDAQIVPGLNTTFLGMPTEHGVFEERCQACGDCVLGLTGGVCPIARCSKQLLNGPCGGSQNRVCEIDPETQCAWQLIYERMEARGQLDRLLEIQPPKDWSTSRDGGPRKIVREDLRKLEDEE